MIIAIIITFVIWILFNLFYVFKVINYQNCWSFIKLFLLLLLGFRLWSIFVLFLYSHKELRFFLYIWVLIILHNRRYRAWWVLFFCSNLGLCFILTLTLFATLIMLLIFSTSFAYNTLLSIFIIFCNHLNILMLILLVNA
jgi:hypothetical protein